MEEGLAQSCCCWLFLPFCPKCHGGGYTNQ